MSDLAGTEDGLMTIIIVVDATEEYYIKWSSGNNNSEAIKGVLKGEIISDFKKHKFHIEHHRDGVGFSFSDITSDPISFDELKRME